MTDATGLTCVHCAQPIRVGEWMVAPWIHENGFYVCLEQPENQAEPHRGSL